jgi:hypothetical protein
LGKIFIENEVLKFGVAHEPLKIIRGIKTDPLFLQAVCERMMQLSELRKLMPSTDRGCKKISSVYFSVIKFLARYGN